MGDRDGGPGLTGKFERAERSGWGSKDRSPPAEQGCELSGSIPNSAGRGAGRDDLPLAQGGLSSGSQAGTRGSSQEGPRKVEWFRSSGSGQWTEREAKSSDWRTQVRTQVPA